MVFNATFNNISFISRRSVLLVDETVVPGEKWSNYQTCQLVDQNMLNVKSYLVCLVNLRVQRSNTDVHEINLWKEQIISNFVAYAVDYILHSLIHGYRNTFVFACPIKARSQCWLFTLIYPYLPSYIRICHISCRAWYGSLGLIPGPIWKMSCNNLLQCNS